MRPRVYSLLLSATLLAFHGCGKRERAPELEPSASNVGAALITEVGPVFTKATYDPKADASADLAATIATASNDGKRIILEIGGDW